MAFLDHIQNKFGVSNTTKGLYLGTPDAEGEIRKGQCLLDFFEDYMNVLGDITTE